MEVLKLPLGELMTNCYIVYNDKQEAVIIDPGAEPERILKVIIENHLHVKGILLTHSHFDHIGATDEINRHLETNVYAHKAEAGAMLDQQQNLAAYFGDQTISAKVDKFVDQDQEISFGHELKFKCLVIPGHTSHSVCFYMEDDKILFSGDTLFNDGIGRTDFYQGDATDLAKNIVRELFDFPVDTYVYPGHGMVTTLGKEKRENIYLKGYFWNE